MPNNASHTNSALRFRLYIEDRGRGVGGGERWAVEHFANEESR